MAQALGKYTLIARLATGGMAEILLARLRGAAGFEKLVVIKRLLPHLRDDERSVELFVNEARIVARITHPNVCQVHELAEEDGRYYIVMEYLEGVPLTRVVRRLGAERSRDEVRLVCALLQQACEGLHHAHELRGDGGARAGVVHRDVSPQNLFVTTDGVCKVLDFGVAKARVREGAAAGPVHGKSAYMSPEQLRGAALDRRADVFSLGVVLHEALAGRSLFQRETKSSTRRAIREDTLPELWSEGGAIPRELDAVVRKAVARDPGERYPDARAFGAAIAAAAAPLGGLPSAIEIADWLIAHLGDELKARREQVTQAAELADAPAGHVPDDDGEHTRPIARDATGTVTIVLTPAPESEADVVAAAPPAARRRRWAALAAAGVLALAAAAVLALTGGSPPATTAARAAGPGAEPAPPPAPAPAPTPEPAPTPAPAPVAVVADAAPPAAAPPRKRPRSAPPAAETPAEPGFFTVDSRPYAKIYIDGKLAGPTPLLRVPLAPGSHSVRAVLEDGRSQEFGVVIEPGREARRRRLVW